MGSLRFGAKKYVVADTNVLRHLIANRGFAADRMGLGLLS